MSTIVNRPSADSWRYIAARQEFQPFNLKVKVPTEGIPLRIVDEFLEFLTMVYGSKIRITQKNTQSANFVLYLHDRSESGLRVASFIYGFSYETARVYA